jgi:RNA-directed DNA polymerase
MDKTLLKKWLKAGYMEQTTVCLTEKGIQQGAIISPCLMLLTLSGLEKAAKAGLNRSDKVNVISYADDFVITGNSKEVLENHVKPNVEAFLKQRGLKLSREKTKITHIKQGFDFLGFNVRKYQETLLIKPAKKNIKSFLAEIRGTIKLNPTAKTESLINLLNPKIRGWANYYSNVVSKKVFSYVDNNIYKAIFNWSKRRHPNKGLPWVKKKYFRSQDLRNWIFFAKISDKQKCRIIDLFEASRVKIRRQIKIKPKATPFDPEFLNYLRNRKRGIKCLR